MHIVFALILNARRLLQALQYPEQHPAVAFGEGEQIAQPQGQIANAEERPGSPKKCRQQQIHPRPGGQGQSLPVSAGKRRPDYRAPCPKLQGLHGNIQQPEGGQVPCLVAGGRQQKGQRQSPPVQQPKAHRQQPEACCDRDLQKASPEQPMRQERGIYKPPAAGQLFAERIARCAARAQLEEDEE